MARPTHARITPYTYYDYGTERLVFIDEDNKHPDPSHKLLWGYEKNGDFLKGDFKNKFTKAGKTIHIKINYPHQTLTATDEQKARFNAIETYLRTRYA